MTKVFMGETIHRKVPTHVVAITFFEKQIDVPIYAISYQPFFPVILDGIILSIKNYTTFYFSFAWTYPKPFFDHKCVSCEHYYG